MLENETKCVCKQFNTNSASKVTALDTW